MVIVGLELRYVIYLPLSIRYPKKVKSKYKRVQDERLSPHILNFTLNIK